MLVCIVPVGCCDVMPWVVTNILYLVTLKHPMCYVTQTHGTVQNSMVANLVNPAETSNVQTSGILVIAGLIISMRPSQGYVHVNRLLGSTDQVGFNFN